MKLIQLAIKYCKKIVCVLLIVVTMMANSGFAKNNYVIDEMTREELLNKAQVIKWEQFENIMDFGSRFIVVDYYTGAYFVCERHMGGLHADIETVDKEATKSLKSLYEDRENWKHRPVIIVFPDGKAYVGSCFVVGHAGRDDQPFLKVIKNRSHGYGAGENYDKIKGNGLDGHICIHVRGSKNHYNQKESPKHQQNIDYLENKKINLGGK